jgi:hypothetical protein
MGSRQIGLSSQSSFQRNYGCGFLLVILSFEQVFHGLDTIDEGAIQHGACE